MTSTPTSSPTTPPLFRSAAGGAWLVLAATVAGSAGRWHWLLDLASHFRWYLLLGGCIWLVAMARRLGRPAAAGLLVAIVWNAAGILPYWLSTTAARQPLPAAAPPISIATVNVESGNTEHERLRGYLRRRRPDLVAILELTPAWAQAVDDLADLYPHRLMEPRPDNSGVAVLSRWPLVTAEVQAFGITPYPNAIVLVQPDRGPAFRFVATHPYPPVNAEATRRLRTQLAGLADFLARPGPPTIVAGDLNATPWSVAFRDFVSTTGLRDSSLGHGLQPTWNARLWLPRIPIDHILVPRDTVVLRRAVGPALGSDHLPVEAELILAPHAAE